MSRIRLTYLINDMISGGAEMLLWNVIRRLDHDRFDCTVISMFFESDFPAVAGVRYVPLRLSPERVLKRPGNVLAVWNALSAVPSHILHTHLSYADDFGQAFARLQGTRLVYSTIHNIVEWPRERRTLRTTVEDLLLRSTTRVIAVGETLRRQVIQHRHCPPEQIITVLNGLDLEVFAHARRHRDAMRASLGAEPGDLVILCTAQFRHEKRHDLILDAFAHVLRHTPSAHLVLAGNNGDRRAWIEAWIRERDMNSHVHVVSGDREYVAELCGAADVFTMHSEHEGYSLALIEAMASGLPVAVPDIEIFREAVTEGREGLLFPFGDTAAQADRILTLWRLGNSPQPFWQSVAARVRIEFSVERHVDRLTSLYLQDLAKWRR